MRIVPMNLRERLQSQGRWLATDATVPEIDAAVYVERAARLAAAQADAGFDALVFYADREHSANLAWLSGFSPRFEEAICVLVAGRRPTLLVGNENLAFARGSARIEMEVVLHQDLSLPDQDRSLQRPLLAELRNAGLGQGMRVGLLGWKPGSAIEVPHYLVRAVEDLSGNTPVNAADLLMDAGHGLRTRLEPALLRLAEYSARLTSQAVMTLIASMRPGQTEREAAGHLNAFGLELSCHTMVNFAAHIDSGLGSPRNRRLARGDYAQMAFGVLGGLTCRAGRVIGRDDADADDYLELLANYLDVARAWWGALRVGATGGEVWLAANAARNASWQPALNPGHLLHLEEWLASPFAEVSTTPLRSGMALQQDIIPVPHTSRAAINMEDGLALADAELRKQLTRLDPALMQRCQARRDLMQELGYALHADVLPLSDSAGVMTPFLLAPGWVVQA